MFAATTGFWVQHVSRTEILKHQYNLLISGSIWWKNSHQDWKSCLSDVERGQLANLSVTVLLI